MKPTISIFFFLSLVMTCPVLGQVAQKQLTEADYKLWSTMEVEQLSDAGNWVSYSLHYESGNDTLFVKHTKTKRTFAFAGGGNGKFVNDELFVCQDSVGQLLLTSLTNGKKEVLSGVSSFSLSKEGRFLFVKRNSSTETQELLIKDLESKQVVLVPNVTSYSYNEKANALVCDSERQLLLFELGSKLKKDVIASDGIYSDFVWQKNGESLAYFSHGTSTKMIYYRLKEQQSFVFEPSAFSDFPKDSELYNGSGFALTIADDGSKVFFGVKPKEAAKDTTGVQIWNTADKVLYPYKLAINGWNAVPKLGVWFPENNHFTMLTTAEFPKAMLAGEQKFAILYNPITNEPQFNHSAPIDFYLKNLETDKQQLILSRQSFDESKLSVSATGRYVAYFKDRQWWIYDITTETHRNLTQGIGVSFERENFDWAGEVDACGIAGWTDADGSLLVYDDYDVWLVKIDGSSSTRLTHGREEHIVYRVIPQSESNFTETNFNWIQRGNFNLKDGLLLQAKSDSMSGYFMFDCNKGLRKLVFEVKRVSNIKLSKLNEVTVYIEEHFHESPKLMVQYKNNSNSKLLFQSNPQQKNYQWGFSKLITYENSKGQLLKGALFYPAGYTPERSYPMVVQIYEHLSDRYNEYINPSQLNSGGFNISNFTTQGYFVLLPDIVKEQGNTGRSALDCVESAVKEVLAHESVDSKRLGLLGHSFGGYQTNFIITQTNMFAVAVSSGGASDIISDYLYVAWNISRPNGFRYEFSQANMGISPFDDYELYLRNSPITYAKQVQTPLLLWAGEDDKQVHYFQSLEFHLALRRLQKPNILLLYEGERHNITNRADQIDLTHRVEEWVAYYLKGGERPDWFTVDKL